MPDKLPLATKIAEAILEVKYSTTQPINLFTNAAIDACAQLINEVAGADELLAALKQAKISLKNSVRNGEGGFARYLSLAKVQAAIAKAESPQ